MVRRALTAVAAAAVVLPVGVGVAVASAGGSGEVNGVAAPSAAVAARSGEGAAPAQRSRISCDVLDPQGDPTTTVEAGLFGSPAYFLSYSPNGNPTRRVTFIVRALSPDNPLREQRQVFDIADDRETGITTPFGIPTWGLDRTSGPYELVVRTAGGRTATCPFTVVP